MKRLALAVISLAGLGLVAQTKPAERWFEDITKKAGVDKKHTNRVFENPYATIMAGFQIVVLLENNLCCAGRDRHGRSIEVLVRDEVRIINKDGIRGA